MERVEVGFLGLGIMGKAMAMNLLRHEFKVTVWNRTLSKLVEHGASTGETPATVIKKCKYTIGMLSDPAAALSVSSFKMGFWRQFPVEKVILICQRLMLTLHPRLVRSLIHVASLAITATGGSFIEAPVSGSKKPAEDGQLIILAAGEKALYEEAIPLFDVLGKKYFFLGQVGNGAKMKLVVNMIMGSMMNAFSEGLVLADESGLSQKYASRCTEFTFWQDLGGMANPMFRMKGPAMIQSSYSPQFPLKHQQKNMRLALALGDETAVSMPVAAAANEVLLYSYKNGG
ncbi:3-hydroxyisobutyrate dehydrogenase-like, NAD-binding domain [Dillenia turbinata]|uniref:3-hydroxyisobutyrate dehydrogenase-like, NAD-binding domain n=1 Tax=Dillenia turbinata TaxID=194707 RepID=A0AAN8ZJI5_9MAGN